MSVMEKIAAFIAQNHGSPEGAHLLDPEESLMAAGLIDSLGILKLIAFIEGEFNIELQPDEVNLQNFASLASITRLVEARLK